MVQRIGTVTRTAIMRHRTCTALASVAFLCTAGAAAQAEPALLGASPLPPQVESRFCFYSGLAYSEGAVITIHTPIRREVVTDRPRMVMRCVSGDGPEGRFHWKEVDPDAGDPFRN